jgi:hypothetical protein
VTLKGINPFNNVCSGLLRLKGRILKGKMASDVYYFPRLRLLVNESLNEIAYYLDEDLGPGSTDETVLFCVPVSIKHRENSSDSDDGVGNKDKVEGKRGIISDGEVEAWMALQGLVLEPSHASHGQY